MRAYHCRITRWCSKGRVWVSESFIFDLGRNLLFFVALQLTGCCKGIENSKRLCSPFYYVQEEWTVPAKPFSEDCWHLGWILGKIGTSTAAHDHLWLKRSNYIKNRPPLQICVDTEAEDAGTIGPKAIRFHCNCLCAHFMVYCSVAAWREGNNNHIESYTQQLIRGKFWSQHFKIQPPLEIVTPFQSVIKKSWYTIKTKI